MAAGDRRNVYVLGLDTVQQILGRTLGIGRATHADMERLLA